jgi:hypothetical protein
LKAAVVPLVALLALNASAVADEKPDGYSCPQVIHREAIKLPSSLRAAKLSGVLILAGTVNVQGRLENLQIVHELDPAAPAGSAQYAANLAAAKQYTQAALASLASWKLRPGTVAGEPRSFALTFLANTGFSKKPSLSRMMSVDIPEDQCGSEKARSK